MLVLSHSNSVTFKFFHVGNLSCLKSVVYQEMARILPVDFEMVYKLNFETVIRRHHVYKAVWSPEIGEKLECYEDTRKEAKDYDEHSVGIFKLSSKKERRLLSDTFLLNFHV